MVQGLHVRSRHAAPPDGDVIGPPLVLVAGLGLSGRYLLPLGAELAERHDVWIPDLPGFGRSEAPSRKVLGMAELGDATVAWMDAVGMRRAVLVANSAGCQIAVEAAARHADRIGGMVLEAPTIDASARSVIRHLGRVVLDSFHEPFSLWWVQIFDWLDTGPRRLVGTVRHTFAHRVEERLPLVTCPAVVVRGSLDRIVPMRWAAQVAAALPHGTLRLEDGASHAMPYSAPQRLAATVTAFVRSL